MRMAWLQRLLHAVVLLLVQGSAVGPTWWANHSQPAPTWPRAATLPSVSRRRRALLTQQLNAAWLKPEVPVWDPLLPWRPRVKAFFPRRRGRLFHRRTAVGPRRARWRGWPQRGCRIGEATNPGPPLPGTPIGGDRPARERSPPRPAQRVFCPVPCCPCSDARRARGWTNVASMKNHIDAHLAGSLQGDVPATWLDSHALAVWCVG